MRNANMELWQSVNITTASEKCLTSHSGYSGGRTFQSINSIGTDNLSQLPQQYFQKKNTKRETQKLALTHEYVLYIFAMLKVIN